MGGSALSLYYLLREMPPEADPLGPDNLLIFATGPLNGSVAPQSNRFAVVTKSPLTGRQN